MTDAKREEIKDKVAASEARQQERGPAVAEPEAAPHHEASALDKAGETAVEVKDKIAGFVREHPIATVAGALALGVAISGMFRNSPTRKAGSRAGAKAAGLAAIGAEMAAAYAHKALGAASDARDAGAERLDDLSHSMGRRARHWRREAAHYADEAGHTAQRASHRAGKAIRRRLRDRGY